MPLIAPDVPALSIRQPWVWCILFGGKKVENRKWRTHYRGPILLHAAQGMTYAEYDDAQETWVKALLRGVAPRGVPFPAAADLKRGGIVGRADLTDVITESDDPYFFGKFGFVLENARPLPFTPCNGRLGFFKPGVPLEDAA
jgi:hypothetical protein